MLALGTNAKLAKRVEHSVTSWRSSMSPKPLGPKREQPKDAIASSLASPLELGPPARAPLSPDSVVHGRIVPRYAVVRSSFMAGGTRSQRLPTVSSFAATSAIPAASPFDVSVWSAFA